MKTIILENLGFLSSSFSTLGAMINQDSKLLYSQDPMRIPIEYMTTLNHLVDVTRFLFLFLKENDDRIPYESAVGLDFVKIGDIFAQKSRLLLLKKEVFECVDSVQDYINNSYGMPPEHSRHLEQVSGYMSEITAYLESHQIHFPIPGLPQTKEPLCIIQRSTFNWLQTAYSILRQLHEMRVNPAPHLLKQLYDERYARFRLGHQIQLEEQLAGRSMCSASNKRRHLRKLHEEIISLPDPLWQELVNCAYDDSLQCFDMPNVYRFLALHYALLDDDPEFDNVIFQQMFLLERLSVLAGVDVSWAAPLPAAEEELFHFIRPSVIDDQERLNIHLEVKNLVRNNTAQFICSYLSQMVADKKILLPPQPEIARLELVRLGMPDESNDGFTKKNFYNYYQP